jgi:photosynthetic reaction center cytochrome c subunit
MSRVVRRSFTKSFKLTNWRSGAKQPVGDRDYQVVQGIGPRNVMATLYFDPQTGLLARMIRYSPSPVGRMPTKIDFGDYRDVGGVRRVSDPFRM